MILIFIILFLFSCTHAHRNPSSPASKVLHIGDSQTAGYFGKFLYEHFKKEGHFESIRVFGVGSSSPRHWSAPQQEKNGQWLCERKGRLNLQFEVPLKDSICPKEPEVSAFSLLNKEKDSFVIFQFLGNSMGFSEDYIKSKIQILLSELSPTQECLFITSPPYYHELEERNQLRTKTEEFFISAIGDRCTIYRGMNQDNMNTFRYQRDHYLGDRIHLSQKGALNFYKQIAPYLP